MSTGISVTGGGSVAIDTARMDDARIVALRIGVEVAMVRGRIDRILADEPGRAEEALLAARAIADQVSGSVVAICGALEVAAQRYGALEARIATLAHAAYSARAAAFGAELRTALIFAPELVPALVIGAGLVEADVVEAAMLRSLIRTGHPNPLTDPAFDDTVGGQLGSLDDLVRGFLGIETKKDLVTDDPKRPFSESSIATFFGGLLALIPGTSGRVRVHQVSRTVSTHLPKTIEEAVEHIEQPQKGRPQIRIDMANVGAERVAIVTVSGTVTFDPTKKGEPFDDVSILQQVGGTERSAAEQSIIDAMQQAGIGKDVPVLFVGHSQGALAVTRVALDGGFTVGGVITIGGPTRAVQLPASVPVLALENTDDLVPRLGGSVQGVDNRVVVSRTALGPLSPSGVLPSHEKVAYVETAGAADRSDDPRVQAVIAQMAPFLSGDLASTNEYRADIEVSAGVPTRRVVAATVR